MNDGERHVIPFKCMNPIVSPSGIASGNMMVINCDLDHPRWGQVGEQCYNYVICFTDNHQRNRNWNWIGMKFYSFVRGRINWDK